MSEQHATTSAPVATPQMTREEFRVWLDFHMGATVRRMDAHGNAQQTEWKISQGWYEAAGIHSRGWVAITRKGPWGETITSKSRPPHQLLIIT